MTLAALRTAWAFLQKVPVWVYLVIVAVVYHVAAIHIAENRGRDEADAKWTKVIAEQKAAYDMQVAALKARQQDVITKTVVEYRDRVKVIKEKGDEIVKQVPVYVPMDSPLLAGGVRVIHDAAASGDMPDDPVRAIAAADPVETSTLLSTVAANYETCRADQERLSALQKLVSSLQEKP